MNTHNKPSVFTPQHILIFILLLSLFVSACSLSTVVPAVVTEVAATVDGSVTAVSPATDGSTPSAANAGTVVTPPPTPNAPPAQPTANSANPSPTKTTAASSQAAADTTAPVFTSVDASDARVFYNDASCGKTAVTIRATVTDDTGLSQVWVNYLFAGNNGGGNWHQMNLTAVGNNKYEATIDIAQMVGNDLQGSDGVMQYQVMAEDAAGNGSNMPDGHPYGVEVLSCGALGAPPQPGNSPITISNIQNYPNGTIYYGTCGNDPTSLNVQATIDPLDQIASAQLVYNYENKMGASPSYVVDMFQLGIGDYAGDIDTAQEADNAMGTDNGLISYSIMVTDRNGDVSSSPPATVNLEYCTAVGLPPAIQMPTIVYFNGSATVQPNDTVFIEWNVEDACRVFFDGIDVNAMDSYQYSIPSNEPDRTYNHILTAWGSSCDNNTEAEEVVTIQVQSGGGNNGNGNNGGGTIAFINNSSQPIISLIIDGAEMYPSEPMGILAGGTENITVGDGVHSFTAANGWWNGGVRNEMYTFSGSFTAQDGDVTFTDPTIAELLTDWGSSRYFKSFYMDGGDWHDVGFCFYADSTFIEYDNGTVVDSGSYADIGHDSQLVNTRLTGQSVSVDALYYKAFGSLDVPRGNVVDEYMADSTIACP